jgi:hypothetical protein
MAEHDRVHDDDQEGFGQRPSDTEHRTFVANDDVTPDEGDREIHESVTCRSHGVPA